MRALYSRRPAQALKKVDDVHGWGAQARAVHSLLIVTSDYGQQSDRTRIFAADSTIMWSSQSYLINRSIQSFAVCRGGE